MYCFFPNDDKSGHLSIQKNAFDRTYFFPSVKKYDDILSLPNNRLIKPKDLEVKLLLCKHNISNYTPSTKVIGLIAQNKQIKAYEMMAEEIIDMTDRGIAFNLK